jgi:multidrug efflux pump subunit AcrB
VIIFGARDYSMRIWLRPDVMAQYGLTTTDVANAVREQNAQFAVGKIVAAAAGDSDLQLTYTVTAEDRLKTAEQFGEIVLRAESGGRPCTCATSLGSSSAPATTPARRASTVARPSSSPFSCSRAPTPWRRPTA